MFKFNKGDIVIYGKQYDATIIKTTVNIYGNDVYVIEFHNKNLIPPQMEADEGYLEIKQFSPNTHCPICNTKYTITRFNMAVWYDCPKCKDSRENILDKYKKISDNNSNRDSGDEDDETTDEDDDWFNKL